MRTFKKWLGDLWLLLNVSRYRAAMRRAARLKKLEEASEFWTMEAEREYVAAMRAYNVGDNEAGNAAKARYRTAMVRLKRDVMMPLAEELAAGGKR